MSKQLVICPNCKIKSKNDVRKWRGKGLSIEVVRPSPFRANPSTVLGEIDEDRNFKIRRGAGNYTIISGSRFGVICGNCGELAYRKEVNNDRSIGKLWLHRQTISGTLGTVGL